MDLERDKRQNIQKKLDFSSEQTGEARQAGREETESQSVAIVAATCPLSRFAW